MNIEVNINEIKSVENIMSKILEENDFNKMNELVEQKKSDIEKKFLFPSSLGDDKGFVSVRKNSLKPYVKFLSEEDFFKIVGATLQGISKTSTLYQEKLYGHYMEALKLHDEGYISDVLYKALEFQTNSQHIQTLMKNKIFINEWQKDFGSESPLNIFKHKGDMRLINIIKERARIE